MYTVGPELWREPWKTWKTRNRHCQNWNIIIFHCFSPYPMFYSECVSFYIFFRFLAIFLFLFCEFHIFVCHFSCHITDPTLCMSHFPRFSVFSPYARSYSVHLSFFMFLSISRHIPGPTMWVSHFPHLSVFSTYSRSYSVCASFSTFFSFLAMCQALHCTFIIFHVFQCFSPYSRSCSILSHFSPFSVFLAIFQVLPCEFLIFFVGQFSCHNLGLRVYISYLSRF